MSTIPLPLFSDQPGDGRVVTTPEIDALLAADAPVAIGVSGGKDSTAVGFATVEHLDRIGHKGPRLLIHADLGLVEWADSLPACRRLADRLGLELVVVRRAKGGMMERWEQRFGDNLKRWLALSCVRFILPWSTKAMRYCTSELKVDQITRDLRERFPRRTIVNVTGVRRSESTERQDAPVSKPNPKLTSKKHDTTGVDWNGIALWSEADVWAIHDRYHFERHEAYRRFNARRVSCVACILATAADHCNAALDERNHPILLRMVDLEILSTFAFQGKRWLGDTLAAITTAEQKDGLARAKERAARRVAAERRIPKHLLYKKGWPTCEPTREEAVLLGEVRAEVAAALGVEPTFTDPDAIIARYRELLAEKAAKEAAQANKSAKRSRRRAA